MFEPNFPELGQIDSAPGNKKMELKALVGAPKKFGAKKLWLELQKI